MNCACGASFVGYCDSLMQANHSPLYGEGGSRREPGGVNRREYSMSHNDWKKTLPFKRHWAFYLAVKLLVLALAAFIAWHLLRVFEVV
jgi:hypothetical protein